MIRPFLALMTRSELHAVLTCGFATIGGEYLSAFIPLGVSLHSLGYNLVPLGILWIIGKPTWRILRILFEENTTKNENSLFISNRRK